MSKRKFFIPILFSLVILTSCEKEKNEEFIPELPPSSAIADHEVAFEDILRSIPETYIDQARNQLHVAYQHTSHGTHVSYGLFGLQDF